MQVYSVELDDFSNSDYALIGIHTSLQGYKLAYLLNKQLAIRFKLAEFALDFEKQKASFTVFDYFNKALEQDFFLISNAYKDTETPITEGLFATSDTRTYLIPEKKKVDFFLKMEGDYTADFLVKTVAKINNIPQVVTSYSIEATTLKSKDYLIF